MTRRLLTIAWVAGWLLWSSLPLSAQPPAALPPPTQSLDWEKISEEAVKQLQAYLQVDTSNPPGNELKAAEFFQRLFAAHGIEAQIFEAAPGRGNVYARLKGDGSKRPLLLMNHMDVVRAERENWTVEPFAGLIKDGYLYGRGALDMKASGLLQAMTLINLKRAGVKLTRDVIFLGTADEEVDSIGTKWLIKHHPEIFRDVEYVLTEGGDIEVEAGQTKLYTVNVTEKAPLWLRLTATGRAGHGSRPFTEDNAVLQLLRALNRIADYQTPIKLTPAAEKFFAAIAQLEQDPVKAAKLRHLKRSLKDRKFAAALLANQYYNAILRNTISITVLQGSQQTNVIPTKAVAELDIRLLPDEDPDQFVATLRRIMGNDQIKLERTIEFHPPLASPVESEVIAAIEAIAQKYDPGVPVATTILSGWTESSLMRPLGIKAYGFEPFKLDDEEGKRVHGNDERISLDNIRRGVRMLYDIVVKIAA